MAKFKEWLKVHENEVLWGIGGFILGLLVMSAFAGNPESKAPAKGGSLSDETTKNSQSASTSTASKAGNAANTTTSTSTAPAKTVKSIRVTAAVSNTNPGVRSTETIFATVKDGYGNPISKANVTAIAYYKTGQVTYTLKYTSKGNYSVSFGLSDKFESRFRVPVKITATYYGFSAVASTAFTPIW